MTSTLKMESLCLPSATTYAVDFAAEMVAVTALMLIKPYPKRSEST